MTLRWLTCLVLLGSGAIAMMAACGMASEDGGGGDSTANSSSGPPGPGGGGVAGGAVQLGEDGPDYGHGEWPPGMHAEAAEIDVLPTQCAHLDPELALTLYLPVHDSNAMASPVHARERLRSSLAPIAVRPQEFLNYYRIRYPDEAPAEGILDIEAHADVRDEQGGYDLQIGVRSFDAVTPRRPMSITFVLDTSGSMAEQSMIRERAVVRAVAESLQAGDVVSMVTWDTSDAQLLSGHVASGPNDDDLLEAAEALTADGGTDLHGGLVAGYALAQEHYLTDGLNRVVLVSDGGTNAGVTDETLIASLSEDTTHEGIYLVGVGIGPAESYNDLLMSTVTDKGRGAYVYVDGPEEARHMFVDRFDEVMDVAARAVQVQLTLPWYFEMLEFLGEKRTEAASPAQPQHLAPSDAMIFHHVLRACSDQVVLDEHPILVDVSWQIPGSQGSTNTNAELTLGELLGAADKAPLHKGLAIAAYAEALKAGTSEALNTAHTAVLEANADGSDPELTEITELLTLHPAYEH